MRAALRGLASDDWVIGLAAAIAIGYASVVFVHSLVELVAHAIRGDGFGGPFSFVVAGHRINYEGIAWSGVTLAVLIVVAALLLRRTRAEA